jgi:hypothetical protein
VYGLAGGAGPRRPMASLFSGASSLKVHGRWVAIVLLAERTNVRDYGPPSVPLGPHLENSILGTTR